MILIQRITLSLEPLILLISNSCHLWIRDEWRISAICCDCHIIIIVRIFLWHRISYFSGHWAFIWCRLYFMHVILNFSFNSERHILPFCLFFSPLVKLSLSFFLSNCNHFVSFLQYHDVFYSKPAWHLSYLPHRCFMSATFQCGLLPAHLLRPVRQTGTTAGRGE